MCIVWKMTADIVSKGVKDTYTNTDTMVRGIVMRNCNLGEHPKIRDYGSEPFVFNIRFTAITKTADRHFTDSMSGWKTLYFSYS